MPGLREIYEAEFEERLFSLRPASVLDIGCGEGHFLRRATARGIRAVGVDANAERVTAATRSGLIVQLGTADKLPFADASFDMAVCERSAHHFPDLRAGIAETLRVARALAVFDPWYDETIPSQKSAADLDRWMKRVHTAKGHTNKGPFSAQDILAAFPFAPTSRDVTVVYRVNLEPAALSDAVADCEKQLADWDGAQPFRRELGALLANAEHTGLSGTGALMVFVR